MVSKTETFLLETIRKMESFTFEGYWLVFDPNIKHVKFNDDWGYGIKFYFGNVSYELFHNRVGMSRIFISEGMGHLRDIPFHAGTIPLIPQDIKWRKILKGYEGYKE